MKITYVILSIYFICFLSQCFGEENPKEKVITSSYSYSIEYNDSDHGNFGHKIEVKDGNAKVNIRSENPKQYNSLPNNIKEQEPQKTAVYSKPKEEVTYVPTSPVSQYSTAAASKTQTYTPPQVHLQPQKSPLAEPALQKYSQQQLAILLSQNKNPFLPLDPKDSINKFIDQYVKQPGQTQATQGQPHGGHVPQMSTNYVSNYHVQSPSVNVVPTTKPQYQTYYQPVQQNQQEYYQPATAQSPAPHSPTPSQVQYVYVPQHVPQMQVYSMPLTQTSPVQFVSHNNQPTSSNVQQQYYPQFVLNNIPKTNSYSTYGAENQQIQQPTYSSGYTPSVSPAIPPQMEAKQYVTVPSNPAYQPNIIMYIPKASNEATYQYGHSAALVGSSTSNLATNSGFKPSVGIPQQLPQNNFDFSKLIQYVPASNYPTGSTNSHYIHGQPTGVNYATSSAPVQTTTKSTAYGSLFTSVQPSPNYGTYSGPSGTSSEANKYISNAPNYSFRPQANPNYKSSAENSAPVATKLQYQSPNVNKISMQNFDFGKFQTLSHPIPSITTPYNLNQVSNIQATDNNHRQYVIDYKQGTNHQGSSQISVQTNYNLGAQNAHVPPQTDNSNVRYIYVPTYAPASPAGTHPGQ